MFYACNNTEPVVHCFTYETERVADGVRICRKGRTSDVSEHIWETFDSLFKTVHRQGRRVEELEARIVNLERLLREREAAGVIAPSEQRQPERLTELPVERAA